MDNGFIVRSGRISSNPQALSGTVDSSGNVHFTGPSPYGGSTATFTGSIGSDGNGDGSYRDGQGLVGSWSVARVSGGGGGFNVMGIMETILDLMYSFSFIGEAVGLSGTTAAAVGMSAVIFVVVSALAIVSTRASQRKNRAIMDKRGGDKPTVRYDFSQQRPYEAEGAGAGPSVTSPGTQGAPPSTIGVPPPPVSPPVGLHVERPGLPDRLDVNANWRSPWVDVNWESPLYDPEKYELYGYEIIRLYYDGSSTAASRQVVAQLPRESLRWRGPFEQTYRWNTGGDLEGYRVDALFRDLNPNDPNRIVRIGKTAYSPMG